MYETLNVRQPVIMRIKLAESVCGFHPRIRQAKLVTKKITDVHKLITRGRSEDPEEAVGMCQGSFVKTPPSSLEEGESRRSHLARVSWETPSHLTSPKNTNILVIEMRTI